MFGNNIGRLLIIFHIWSDLCSCVSATGKHKKMDNYEKTDPCFTAEILDQPWRHWSFDEEEFPKENGRKIYECDVGQLPIRRWFGFTVEGDRSEIISGHVKNNRCGSMHPLTLSFDNSLLFQQSMIYPHLKTQVVYGNSDDYLDEESIKNNDDNDGAADKVDERDEKINGDSLAIPNLASGSSHSSSSASPLSASLGSISTNNSETPRTLTNTVNDFAKTSKDTINVTLYSHSEIFPTITSQEVRVSPILPLFGLELQSFDNSHARKVYRFYERYLADLNPNIHVLQQFLFEQHLLINISMLHQELAAVEVGVNATSDNVAATSASSTVTNTRASGNGQGIFYQVYKIFNANQNRLRVNRTKTKAKQQQKPSKKDQELNLQRQLLKQQQIQFELMQNQKREELHKKIENVFNRPRNQTFNAHEMEGDNIWKRERLSMLREHYRVAQLCIHHQFLGRSSCAHALSVPIVIKKCPTGEIYWLEEIVSQCPSAVCVKKMNEIVSRKIFQNASQDDPSKQPFIPLDQLTDGDMKSCVTIIYNTTFDPEYMEFYSRLRVLVAKKLKIVIDRKSKSPRKFLRVFDELPAMSPIVIRKEEIFIGPPVPDIDPDAAGPKSAEKGKKRWKRDGHFDEYVGHMAVAAASASDSIPSSSNTTSYRSKDGGLKEVKKGTGGEECTQSDIKKVKFVSFSPGKIDDLLRISIFLDVNKTIGQEDIMEFMRSLNESGELDFENMTLILMKPGLPEDIHKLRAGSGAARFWRENENLMLCIIAALVISTALTAIFIVRRIRKQKKRRRDRKWPPRVNKSVQTDAMITGYIFGKSTSVVVFENNSRWRDSRAYQDNSRVFDDYNN